MTNRLTTQLHLPWHRTLGILVLFMLVVALAPQAQASRLIAHAQPELLALAIEQPETQVAVIVQKLAGHHGAESLAAQLGGVVTMDLHIINAFAARMPAGAALDLARSAGVRWVSLDAPVVRATACTPCWGSTSLKNAYVRTVGADRVWNAGPKYLQGQGIGVAVVDSGMNPTGDYYNIDGTSRLITSVQFNNGYNQSIYDGFGHGQHVAGIIGGNGRQGNGAYMGIAPMVNLINVKVSDDQGAATAANVVRGLQWINDNKNTYNIRVVNLSLNSSAPESYHTNPIDAAVEILWFNKIVVVASSGNNGKNALFPPANDPFVITVGATDDKGTASTSDDVLASYSGYGTTTDGFTKPDLVAPGTNIVSLRVPTGSALDTQHPDHIVDGNYFRMSGTSMAAPVVAGAVALLLQDEPTLTPDQVKYRLKATARPFDMSTRAGAGYLDVYAAVYGTTTQSANTGIPASKLLWTGSTPLTWSSVNWNSVNWNSVNWNSVNWNSVNWNSVNWNSDYWGS